MPASPPKVLHAAPFRRLEPLLAPALERLAAGDPLRERRVLIISNRLRDHLQERLAREGAFAAVSFLTLRDLAREIAEADLRAEGLRPLPRMGGEALAARALREAEKRLGPLGRAAGAEGYGSALFATLTDLAEGGISP
ncbi:MAG: hypothetical protein V3V62_01305, partial [bacterium]